MKVVVPIPAGSSNCVHVRAVTLQTMPCIAPAMSTAKPTASPLLFNPKRLVSIAPAASSVVNMSVTGSKRKPLKIPGGVSVKPGNLPHC